MGFLQQKYIDELIRQLQIAEETPSIIEIVPAEIEMISDLSERESVLRRFNMVNELFVVPLQRFAAAHEKSLNLKEKYSQIDLSAYSIKNRSRILESVLLRYGYDKDQILPLIPQKIEEVEILVEAKEKGFVESNVLYNAAKVVEARKYMGYDPGTKKL